MDRQQSLTAADVVNTYSEASLCALLRDYGEENAARRIARAMVARREAEPFGTTEDLADLIARVKGGRRGHRHPATQSFQALRMEVNAELDGVSRGIAGGLERLAIGGRLAVISFHSLEDRIVKHFFREHTGRWESLPAGGERWNGVLPAVRQVTRKAVQPSEAECQRNPRARSSKLRVVERLWGPPERKGR